MRRSPSSAHRWLALASAAVLATGCSSDEGAAGLAEPGEQPRRPAPAEATPSPAPAVTSRGPLTGLAVTSSATSTRAAVGIPVLTGTGRRPPEGVDRADLVYVSFPEPGQQRLLAVFQSQDADRVGPIADTRPVDGKMISVLGGVLEHGGGTRGQVTRTDNADVTQFSAVVHPDAFELEPDGALFGATAVARTAGGSPAREGLIPFRSVEAPQEPPGAVEVSVPGQAALVLSYDRSAHSWAGALGQVSITATNVVVQEVEYRELTVQGSGTEGDPEVVGEGVALLLTGDRAVDGTWHRPGRRSLTNYIGTDGVPVRFAPGRTVVLLVPVGTGVQRL